MGKRFTAFILIVDVVMSLLLYLSSQLMLSDVSGNTVTGFNIFSIGLAPQQVAGQAFPPIAWSTPNYPIYVFLAFLAVNACFIARLLTSEDK